ncbi:MAG: tetratricopeptide repeat protein [Muribaculaceae bacterium]|nr:tetratricopeptide repeat protein [Muribaculaceae bacterium]
MKSRLVRSIALLCCTLICAVALTSCLGKKNTAARRNYTAFITRYNIYYNGDEHYKETLAEMNEKYEDDFSRLVLMNPVEAKNDPSAPQPSGNFNRSIEKAQKAIQIRSIKQKPPKKSGKSGDPEYKAWMKRDEYNPFLHNAWMMMGRSQYYNGDFLGAASTFFYISRHFSWLPRTVTEARLWQAQSYISMGWLFEAEMILTKIKTSELENKNLLSLYNSAWADFNIKHDEYDKAIPYLIQAIRLAGGPRKTRLTFLLGQLYARTGQNSLAYSCFKKAGSASSAPYRTKFNARIKQSEVFDGADITPEVKALRRMTRYDRNAEYLDQIYYAIGNLYLSRRDTAQAIANYELAVEKSKRNGIDKAICQLSLGALYFDLHKYEKAQPCYSEAVPLLPESYPDLKKLKLRSDVLDELAVYAQNVTLQDSLLRLSKLPEDEQLKVVNKIIDELKKKEKEQAEAAAREEYLANRDANSNQLVDKNAPNQFNINSDNSWYFYNQSAKNAGKSDFQRKWGARKLEDDWRRRNKATFNNSDWEQNSEEADGSDSSDENESQDENEKTEEENEHANDPHYPEYYLNQIPKTDAERQTCHEIIQEGLYNMGVILKDKLDDFAAARAEFDRLLNDYPDNVYRLDTYYNLYLMAMRQGNAADAEHWRLMIIDNFPDSPYGNAMRDPQYIERLKAMDAEQEKLYAQALDDYFSNHNSKVHQAYEYMEKNYPLSKLMPKFMFINALAYVTEHKPQEFNATIKAMLDRYPDTDLAPLGSAWLKGMAQGRELQSTDSNLRGLIWDTRLGGDSTSVASDAPLEFDLSPDKSQLLVMLFPTDQVPANQLLYEIARFNFRSFAVKDFDIETMNFGRLGMVVIRGFDNMDQLNHYRRLMGESPEFKLMPGVRPVVISDENFRKLLEGGHSFEEYFRYLDEQNYVDAQAKLLPATEIETLSEREDADREENALENMPDSESHSDESAAQTQENESAPDTEQDLPDDGPDTTKDTTVPDTTVPEIPTDKTPDNKHTTRPQYAPGSEGDDDDDDIIF